MPHSRPLPSSESWRSSISSCAGRCRCWHAIWSGGSLSRRDVDRAITNGKESIMRILERAIGLAAAVAVALGLASSVAGAQTPEEIKERGSINIGMLVDFPPFGFLDEKGQPAGYDAEVARLL